jgi:hypothetical protein
MFIQNDQIKCINANGCCLTENQIYKVIIGDDIFVKIKKDNGEEGEFYNWRFRLIADDKNNVREFTIQELEDIFKCKVKIIK